MPDTTYRVVLALSTTGNLSAKVGDLSGKAAAAHAGLGRLGESGKRMGDMVVSAAERMGSALERATDRAFELAKHVGQVGLAVGIAAATYGVVGLNNQLEQTQVSLAAIFKAQGLTTDFEGGFKLAREQVAKMRTDVYSLPGTFGDLANIMKAIATPAGQGGANADEIRRLAGRTMLTSSILLGPEQQGMAGRMMAEILSGSARKSDPLAQRLNLGEGFNQLSAAERLKKVNAELDKYGSAADAYSKTLVAGWTGLEDRVKGTLTLATAGLFERVKHSIVDLNTYIDAHQHQIEALANTVGRRLVAGWDEVESIVKRIAPIVGGFADKLLSMQPAEIAKKLERAGEFGIALKLAPTAIRAGGSLLGSMAGGSEAAGAIGALGAEALPALAFAAATTYGAIHILTDNTSAYHDAAIEAASATQYNTERMAGQMAPAMDKIAEGGKRAADGLGLVSLRVAEFTTSGLSLFIDSMQTTADALAEFTLRIQGVGDTAREALRQFNTVRPEELLRPTIEKDVVPLFLKAMAPHEGASTTSQPKLGAGGGGGGTHIAKVEIVVQGNPDPSRVARLTLAELQKLGRNPTSSNFVPNFQQSKHSGM